MKVINFFKNLIKNNVVLNFNQVNRDLWIEREAKEIPQGSVVLDIGAGSCPYRNLFSHCTYKTQDSQVLHSEQLLGKTGYGEIDYRSDAEHIPVNDASFDVVLCTEVLEHVAEPIKVIHEISRILKSGGKLILTAPLGSGLHQEPYHFYGGYTPYWYEKFLTAAQFEKISIEPNGGSFKHYGQQGFNLIRIMTPWNLKANLGIRFIYFFIWLLALPWLAFIIPFFCYWLDRFDKVQQFTVGYHVTCIKK